MKRAERLGRVERPGSLWPVVLIAAIALQFLVGGPRGLWWSAVFDAGHTPLFGLIALAIFRSAPVVWPGLEARRQWRYALAFTVAVLIGGVTEAVQILGPRDADVSDFLRDVLGAAGFLLLLLAWEERKDRRRWAAAALLGLMILTAAFVPLARLSAAYLERESAFPRICDFEHEWELKFITVSDATLDIVPAPPGWVRDTDDRVGRLSMRPATYPGVMLAGPHPDWRGYDRLLFQIYSEADGPITLEMRINDRAHDDEYDDRFNRSLTVAPGRNDFAIPLDAIEQAPEGRSMDMAAIANVIFFTLRPADSLTVYLDAMRLE